MTEPLNYFKEPWYVEWVLRVFANRFKKCADVEKAQKFAMRDLNKIMEEAMDTGTEVDRIIKKNPKSIVMSHKDYEVSTCLGAYCKWVMHYQPKSIESCERFYAEVEGNKVSGEPDLLVDDVLVDIKCSKKISINYWIQLCTYRALRGESGKIAVLRLDKESGAYEYIVKDYDENLFKVWVGLMRAYVVLKQEVVDDGDSDV